MAINMSVLTKLKKQALVMLCISAFSTHCFADRIKDFADIAGQRSNQLVGYGLVVGLDGTGDQTTQTPFTLQSVLQMIGARYPGRHLNTSMGDAGGRPAYYVQWQMENGRVVVFVVEAESGQIIGRQGG
jgi:uncharacterized membrane protein YkoI